MRKKISFKTKKPYLLAVLFFSRLFANS